MLAIDNLTVRFSSGGKMSRPMVDKARLQLRSGRTLAVIGETGSGKSLMGQSICQLLPHNAMVEGSVMFDDCALLDLTPIQMRQYLGSRIAYVPQSAGLSLNPTMRCNQQVAEVYRERKAMPRRIASANAQRLLASLGLKSEMRYPHVLSGGMKQRVLVGIGLASRPDLLIADEPTKGLDSSLCSDVATMFLELQGANPKMALLVITHDLTLAEHIADEVAVMYAGQVLEQAESSEFFASPQHPYSRALLEALPEHGLRPLKGIAPRPDEIISGCPFHPRCDRADKTCAQQRPDAFGSTKTFVCCWRHA